MANHSSRTRFPASSSLGRGLEPLENRQLLTATPVPLGDINRTTDQLNATNAVQVGGVAYFVGHPTSADGNELFKTDGTKAGTVLVKDINPTTGSDPANFTNLSGTLYFTADDGTSGSELWKSDGTAVGTVRVTDLAKGAYTGAFGLTAFNGSLYFFATTSDTTPPMLYQSDGTAAGTALVTAGGVSLSSVSNLTNTGTDLIFTATSSLGTGIYRLGPGGNAAFVAVGPSAMSHFNAFGGVAYFQSVSRFQGIGSGPVALWKTDGTAAGTQLVQTIDYPVTNGSDYTTLGAFTVSGDRFYFLAGRTLLPDNLWVSDGTMAGTQAIYNGLMSSSPVLQAVGTRSVLFTNKTAASGEEPWVSDGAVAGTTQLVDTVAGSPTGATQFGAVSLAGGRDLFFTGDAIGSPLQIWTTDGTPAGTASNAALPAAVTKAVAIGTLNGTALLWGALDANGGDLYRTDGTAAGTGVLGANIASDGDGLPTLMSSIPSDFFAAGNTVYFPADDGASGIELYKSVNGGAAVRVADLAPGGTSSNPTNFVATDDGTVYFTAVVSGSYATLFRIAPGSNAPQQVFATGVDSVTQTWAVGNQVYFNATSYTSYRQAWWHYDPIANTSSRVLINGDPVQVNTLVRSGAYWYFGTYDARNALYRIDASAAATPQLVAPIPDSANDFPNVIAGDGKTLYFSITTTTAGYELWKSDGTAAGTTIVSDLTPGTASTGIYTTGQDTPLLAGGVLYFNASVSGKLTRTYRTDGTKAGTYAISGIAYGSEYTLFGGKVYCISPIGGGSDAAVFRISGSSATQLTQPTTGDNDFVPGSFLATSNALLVTGRSGNFTRTELWQADSGLTNFRRIAVIASGIVATANDLYFGMFTPATGVEPYRLSLATTAFASGTVFADANGNAVRDAGETALSGVTVYVDANGNGVLDAGELSTVTDASGSFAFTGLTNTGSATRLRVVPPTGYKQTLPTGSAGATLDLSAGSANAGLLFGLAVPPATTTATLSGFVFDDTNKNGVYDSNETKTSGKTVFLDANSNGKLDSGEKSVVTGSGGTWSFTGLAAGTYHVRRVFPSGYSQSNASVDVTVTAGQTVGGLSIGSRSGSVTPPASTASITGFTFNDVNKNGLYDGPDTLAAGKTVFIDLDDDGVKDANEASAVTDSRGAFSFKNLAAGTYHVRRVFPGGYAESSPARYITLTAGQAASGVTIGSKAV